MKTKMTFAAVTSALLCSGLVSACAPHCNAECVSVAKQWARRASYGETGAAPVEYKWYCDAHPLDPICR
ncbi:MAG: hypothetical protein JWR42_2943 [Marmoricola sp.]|nr:hypothetical protein [Marmoricola sp.]